MRSRHWCSYDHWNWELENGETIPDYGFLSRSPSLVTEEFSNIQHTRGVSHPFEKRELDPDREAFEEASVDIFRRYVVGGEGVPSEKIPQDDLLREMREQDDDDGGEEPCEVDHRGLQEPVLKNKDRFENWLSTIG